MRTSLRRMTLILLTALQAAVVLAQGQALRYDGVADFAAVADAPDLDPPGDFTVMVWVKPDLLPTTYYNFILAKNMNYTGWALSTATYSHLPAFATFNDDQDVAQVATSVWPIEPGRWVHLAGRLSGGLVTVWMNGVMTGSNLAQLPTTPSSTELFVGSSLFGGATYWKGSIDQIRIYDRALSAVEIRAAMWDAGTPIDSRIAEWWLDEGSGTTSTDNSGNSHTLFLGTASGYGGVTSPDWVASDRPFYNDGGEWGDLSGWTAVWPVL
ncbi:MAG: LamG domain-containing protein [Holophagales bacterium]|nr:MAG: LamG domain-containing protein [Holophagales bacterium]